MKNDEPKLCSNCVLMDVYRGYIQKDASSLKVCIRLRALALRDGRLFLYKSFNYGCRKCEAVFVKSKRP